MCELACTCIHTFSQLNTNVLIKHEHIGACICINCMRLIAYMHVYAGMSGCACIIKCLL